MALPKRYVRGGCTVALVMMRLFQYVFPSFLFILALLCPWLVNRDEERFDGILRLGFSRNGRMREKGENAPSIFKATTDVDSLGIGIGMPSRRGKANIDFPASTSARYLTSRIRYF